MLSFRQTELEESNISEKTKIALTLYKELLMGIAGAIFLVYINVLAYLREFEFMRNLIDSTARAMMEGDSILLQLLAMIIRDVFAFILIQFTPTQNF